MQKRAQRTPDGPLYRAQEQGTEGTAARRGRETSADIDGHGECGHYCKKSECRWPLRVEEKETEGAATLEGKEKTAAGH